VHPDGMLLHRYSMRGILMEPRINYASAAPGALNAMLALSKSGSAQESGGLAD